MILSAPNYLLELYLGSSVTNQLPFAVSWIDHSNGVTLNSAGGQSNNTTSVTIVSAPSGTVKRQIQELSIYNPNNVAVTVTVQIKNTNVNGFNSVKKRQILQPKETLQYTENSGWTISDVEINYAVLDSRYVNTSGNEVMTGSLTLPSISATTVQAVNYSGISFSGSLKDVSINSGTVDSFPFLKWNGSSWVNTAISYGDLAGDAPITGATEFSALTDTFTYTPQNTGKLVYVREDGTGLTTIASSLFQPSGNYAYLSGASFSGEVTVFSHLAAVTKSFLIRHPFFPLKKLLRYACLEGPENGVYIRGRLIDNDIIELPDYWRKLIDPDSITVQLTPVGSDQRLFIKKIENNKVYLDYDSFTDYIKIDCYYLVQAERCDVPKLIVEI
jgi:hypothetical protein